MNSQEVTKDSVFVIIERTKNENLFLFEKGKNNEYAKIKILYFDKRKEGFEKKEKQGEIIKVQSQPNVNFYEFISNCHPKKLKSIEDLDFNTIEDVSKNSKSVFSKKTYIFIEKLKNGYYNLWKMNLVMHE